MKASQQDMANNGGAPPCSPDERLNAHHMLPRNDDEEQPSRSPNRVSTRKTIDTLQAVSRTLTPPRPLERKRSKSIDRGDFDVAPPLQRKRSISMDETRPKQGRVRRARSRSMNFSPKESGVPQHRSRSMEFVPKQPPRASQHRSRSMDFNPHPLENLRISTLFALDEQKGVTLNLLPTNRGQGRNIVVDVPETLTEVLSYESSDEHVYKHSRPSMHKQASQSQILECEAPSRDQPVVHIKANRRESNSSVVSELSFKDEYLEVVKKQQQLKQRYPTAAARGDAIGSSLQRSRRSLVQPSQIEEAFPNHPHPALEYPPLYFAIRNCPRLLDMAESFFRIRWRLSYPLQKRIPFSRTLRKLNVFMTIAEMILILPFFAAIIACTVYSFVYPSVSISGHAARTPLIFAFATAMRNSLLTLFLGIPFERALWYHKLSARLAYVNGLMHTYVAYVHPDPVHTDDADVWMPPSYTAPGSDPNFGTFLVANQINTGGTMLVVFITLMIITALPWVRHKTFELFYYLHIIFAATMIICAFFHTGILVPAIGACTWGLDLAIRKIGMAFCRYPRKASVRIISDSVVEVCFPKMDGFDYNPGQYIYLAVPELSIFQWHPFSLSSSPEQKIVTLHIRKAGAWTTDLYELAKKKMEISILMEGPYGAVGVDVASPDRYIMVMLFSGGIGVTPMQALCNQLMYEHSTGLRDLKKLSFVWIERDPNVMQKVDVVRRRSNIDGGPLMDADESQMPASLAGGAPQGIASTLLALVPASGVTDAQLEQQYPSTDFDALDKTNDDDSIVNAEYTSGQEEVDDDDIEAQQQPQQRRPSTDEYASDIDDDTMNQSFLDAAYNIPKQMSDEFAKESASEEEVLDLQVYLTARGVATQHLPFVHRGRPDIKELFRNMRLEAIQKGEHRVAVCVCAPKRLVTICQKACTKYSDRKVRFDFHYEVFD